MVEGGIIEIHVNNNQFLKKKVEKWFNEIRVLSNIAATELHAVYAGFIFDLKHRLTNFMRIVPNILNRTS